MALLGEVQGVQAREKDRVQVDIQQVGKVLAVLAGKGVGGPVAAGKGIHEGVQRAPQHHEERVAYRVAFAAAEGSVLKDVGDAGGVRRYRAQRHQEHILAAVRSQVVMHRAGDLVLVLIHPQLQGLDFMAAQQAKGGMADGCRGNLVHAGPDWSQVRAVF